MLSDYSYRLNSVIINMEYIAKFNKMLDIG